MAAETSWHRYGTKLRHCHHNMYTRFPNSSSVQYSVNAWLRDLTSSQHKPPGSTVKLQFVVCALVSVCNISSINARSRVNDGMTRYASSANLKVTLTRGYSLLSSASGGLAPKPPLGLRPQTRLGDFRPTDPQVPPPSIISKPAAVHTCTPPQTRLKHERIGLPSTRRNLAIANRSRVGGDDKSEDPLQYIQKQKMFFRSYIVSFRRSSSVAFVTFTLCTQTVAPCFIRYEILF